MDEEKPAERREGRLSLHIGEEYIKELDKLTERLCSRSLGVPPTKVAVAREVIRRGVAAMNAELDAAPADGLLPDEPRDG